jgi:predicted anti-sigma-YlaC factor YlaD
MSKHMTEWLSAYLDSELRGSRLHDVETHLTECRACQEEFQSLQGLSGLLQEVPVPEFTSPERFAAQVNLRLPHPPHPVTKSKVLETGWWMLPVGLMATWIFISTAILISNMVSTASGFGLLSNIPLWLVSGASGEAYWSVTLGQLGILSGNSLQWAEMTEAFTRTTIPQITWQVSIALLYLSWIAIWRARYRLREHGQLLES